MGTAGLEWTQGRTRTDTIKFEDGLESKRLESRIVSQMDIAWIQVRTHVRTTAIILSSHDLRSDTSSLSGMSFLRNLNRMLMESLTSSRLV